MARTHSDHSTASEMRQDPVTGKWMVLARGRGKRPLDFAHTLPPANSIPSSVDRCPFCHMEEFPQRPDTLVNPRGRGWRIRAFPNKYPAFDLQDHLRAWKVGPYAAMEGAGAHEVIVPRDHNGYLPNLSAADAVHVVSAWRQRYQALMVKPLVVYLQIIENHGRDAGASLEHAHQQLFGLPVLPSDEVFDLLQGGEHYFREQGTCAYCDLLAFELGEGTRIVYQNERFVVACPFVPRADYEQWVLPRTHAPGFEALTDDDLPLFADAVQVALRGLKTAFHDPPYNLYLTSAPCDTEGYVCDADAFSHFHWHVRILPRFQKWAGFELATGVEIVTADPDEAAAYLRTAGRGS